MRIEQYPQLHLRTEIQFLRYREALGLADVLEYNLLRQEREKNQRGQCGHQVWSDDTIRLKEG